MSACPDGSVGAQSELSPAALDKLVGVAPERLRSERERVALRYKLATIMLVYGLAKVFNAQFPVPKPTGLLMPYGESSPQGLLWRFMG